VKLLILSDIHGNLDALHAIRESYDELWVLGDIVNYGPEPREALEAVRAIRLDDRLAARTEFQCKEILADRPPAD